MTERLNRLKLPFTRISAVFGVKPNPISSAESGKESTIGTGGKTRNRKTFWRYCVHLYCALAMKYCYTILYR
jgi:hypothetical protein